VIHVGDVRNEIVIYKIMHFVGLFCDGAKKRKLIVVNASKEEADKHIAEFKDGT